MYLTSFRLSLITPGRFIEIHLLHFIFVSSIPDEYVLKPLDLGFLVKLRIQLIAFRYSEDKL
jgi:hypothetical protein